jgi:hypothetical protein
VLALSAAGNGDGKAQKSEETPPEHPRDVILHDIAERLLVWQLSRRKGKPCINSLLNVFQLTLAQLHCSVAILLRGRWPHGSLPDNKKRTYSQSSQHKVSLPWNSSWLTNGLIILQS